MTRNFGPNLNICFQAEQVVTPRASAQPAELHQKRHAINTGASNRTVRRCSSSAQRSSRCRRTAYGADSVGIDATSTGSGIPPPQLTIPARRALALGRCSMMPRKPHLPREAQSSQGRSWGHDKQGQCIGQRRDIDGCRVHHIEVYAANRMTEALARYFW